MDLANLNQLKVTDLKQLLKQRGLSIVGNKSDLVHRLEESFMKESTSSLNKNQHHQSVSNKIEIDVDAILGDDDDDSSIIGKHADNLIPNEDLLLSENNIVTTVPDVTSNVMIRSNTTSNEKPKNDISNSNKNSKPSTKNLASLSFKNSAPMTNDERKQLRMIKFADPKLLNRAERFNISTTKNIQSQNEKLLKRMQRFGEAVSPKIKTLDENERLKRRKERFGTINDGNNKVNIMNKNQINEAILKRQQRFGVVQTSKNFK